VLYQLLKAYARLAIHLYCTRVVVNKKELLKLNGPVLFAANHPNSFLDGIILNSLLRANVYSLTRGDVFKNKITANIFSWLRLLPVYRHTEGVHKLPHNYTTFTACREVFKKGKMVLIFSEAGSVNEWHLRPLRKGTARLAFASWQQGINVKVIPLAFNYSSFKKFGKEIHLNFGETINKDSFTQEDSDGVQHNKFTHQLQQQLSRMVYKAKDEKEAQHFFPRQHSPIETSLLFIPGLIGWLMNAPFFYLCRLMTELKFKKSDHYDGVLTALLLLGYPFYVLAAGIMAGSYNISAGISLLFILPILAWCWLQVKYLFD
jgi:1-acyl-sn-glycerol-3-phosphate acyltransferase